MQSRVGITGYRSGMAAAGATIAFDIVQGLQLVGILVFPFDELLIYGTSLCIVVPLLLQMLALHYVTSAVRQYWSHAALIFTVIYAVFVSANYLVQLATVIPAKLAGNLADVMLLDQTPHSLFWNFDAIGYICMGLATLFAVPALDGTASARRARLALLAHAAMTPVIAVVYFHPAYSPGLLMLGLPWAITAPLFMVMLALHLRNRAHS